MTPHCCSTIGYCSKKCLTMCYSLGHIRLRKNCSIASHNKLVIGTISFKI